MDTACALEWTCDLLQNMNEPHHIYNRSLKAKITDAFKYYVEAKSFLIVAPQFDLIISDIAEQGVLSDLKNNGPDSAALLLLQSIIKYDDWFNKTLKIFIEMKQNNAASELMRIKDNLDAVYNANQGTEDLQNPQSPTAAVPQAPLSPPQSDFTIPVPQSNVAPSSSDLESDAVPMPTEEEGPQGATGGTNVDLESLNVHERKPKEVMVGDGRGSRLSQSQREEHEPVQPDGGVQSVPENSDQVPSRRAPPPPPPTLGLGETTQHISVNQDEVNTVYQAESQGASAYGNAQDIAQSQNAPPQPVAGDYGNAQDIAQSQNAPPQPVADDYGNAQDIAQSQNVPPQPVAGDYGNAQDIAQSENAPPQPVAGDYGNALAIAESQTGPLRLGAGDYGNAHAIAESYNDYLEPISTSEQEPQPKQGQDCDKLQYEIAGAFSSPPKAEEQNEENSHVYSEIDEIPQVPRIRRHDDTYNFTWAETRAALSTLLGWHDDVLTDTQVISCLRHLKEENGHYVIWHWEKMKRPCIVVTYQKNLKTLLLHKRQDKERADHITQYYIYKNQKSDPVLKNVVTYHLENGVLDEKSKSDVKPIVMLRYPVLEHKNEG